MYQRLMEHIKKNCDQNTCTNLCFKKNRGKVKKIYEAKVTTQYVPLAVAKGSSSSRELQAARKWKSND